jgi:membrane-bound lytic murein transglycosylase A
MPRAIQPASSHLLLQFLAALALCLAMATPAAAQSGTLKIPNSQLEPLSWGELGGWVEDDHIAAFKTFMDSCRAILPRTSPGREAGPMFSALQQVCRLARAFAAFDNEKARGFFEMNFRPVRITTLGEAAGFLTGYYEPIVDGSRTWSQEFQVPVYRKPSNLIPGGRRRITDGFPNKGTVGRKFGRKKIVPYYDRAEIEEGVLTGRNLEICWLKNPIDLLFIQIQGSARIRLPDSSIVRLNYDAHNGYPYTPVGRPLIEMGAIPREEMSMDRIRKWMEENPDVAKDVRRKNRSYVFFREPALSATEEPKGAQGVSLTPGRSIAVDRALHVYGTPFYIEAELPIDSAQPTTLFRRLMVGQDTGSAIVGPARADLYFGAGQEAGQVAGRIRHPGRFAMLVPRELELATVTRQVPLPPERPEFILSKSKAVPLPRPRPQPTTTGARRR